MSDGFDVGALTVGETLARRPRLTVLGCRVLGVPVRDEARVVPLVDLGWHDPEPAEDKEE